MMPAIALLTVRLKRGGQVPLPLPVFLFWPLVLLALGCVELLRRIVPVDSEAAAGLLAARTGLLALFQLSGTEIDLQSRGGDGFQLRLI